MIKHIVRRGECLASIAEAYGFRNWKTVYEAAENESLRERRPNPNVLYEGDELVIPEVRRREEPGGTEKRHRFRTPLPGWVLRVRVLDEAGEAVAEAPFTLTIDGEVVLEDKTADDGLIETEVAHNASSGVLEVLGERIDLSLGHLDPVSRVKGVQQRLNNLAFDAGPVDGKMGERTRTAVAAFQASVGLDATGSIDDETRKELLAAHDQDDQVPPEEQETASAETHPAAETDGSVAEGGYVPPEEVVEPSLPDQWDPPAPFDPLDLSNQTKLIRGTQQRLTALGFDPGPIDGLDGPQTQAGVRAFQQHCKDHADWPDPRVIDSGPVDGIVGPKTKAALESWYGY